MKRFIYIFFLFVLVSIQLFAQEKIASTDSIKGQITCIRGKRPVAFAVVRIIETDQWTTTDENGYFVFPNVSIEDFTLEAQCLGMQRHHRCYHRRNCINKKLNIELMSESYDMKEITVIAKKKEGITTTSTINQAAIEHVQATSLSDVMQLLPGNLIENPDLSEKQYISIREIGNDANSASGTAIIMDGTPINNDGNYQTFSTAHISTTGSSITNSSSTNLNNTTGNGIDLRQISTDNIESIEVISGIPSVVYGDLTSGAVVIKTKSGYSPYKVKIKADPKLKQFYIGKGARLKNGGSANIGLDYTKSYEDLRTEYTSFDRITGQMSYSKIFLRETSPLSFNAKSSFYSTINEEKTDPDAFVDEEIVRSSEKGARLSLYGQWSLNKKLITNLKYNISGSVTQQEDYVKKVRSSGVEKISTSTTEGENEGLFTDSESITELEIKGLPYSFHSQLIATKNIDFDNGIINNTLVGAEFRLTGNNGEGRIYDITNPPTVSRKSSRPRSFKDIPSARSFTVFIEDKITLPIKSTSLDLQPGIRINNFQPTGLLNGDVGIYAEPRFNMRYKLIDSKENAIEHLALHGGIGLNYKSPSLLYLYPDKVYVDLVSLEKYTEGADSSNIIYYTTKILDSSNPDLKPSQNLKREIGVDFKVKGIKGNITFYKESMTNGFGMLSKYHFLDYREYDGSGVATDQKPDISTLPYDTTTYIVGIATPSNNKASEKIGIEYEFDFGKIKAISTQITMNGAWIRTIRNNCTSNYEILPTKSSSGQYEYIGVYPGGEKTLKERFNTTFRFITHIPALRMVFTTAMQVTWYDKTKNLDYDKSPLYLYNREGDIIEFTDEMKNDTEYKSYITTRSNYYFDAETMPPLLLCNFKLSKEFSNNMKLSFYANNFLNSRPIYQYKRSQTTTRRNPSIYFGAEFSIQL